VYEIWSQIGDRTGIGHSSCVLAQAPSIGRYVKSHRGPAAGACGGLLGESCRALGVAFLDLTPALRKAEVEGGPLYWSYDDHMRPVGYRKVEKLVYAWWSTP